MIRSRLLSFVLLVALLGATAAALNHFYAVPFNAAAFTIAAFGLASEYARPKARPSSPPPPHVCPSGFGDRSHEEVSAAILFADAEIAYLDLVGNYRGLFDNDPSRAKDGADFERRKAAEAERSAQRAVLWAVTREREVAYRAVRSRMSGRKS